MKYYTYRGFVITLDLSGWYNVFTSKGYIKADTLAGIKKKIKELAKQKID